MTLTDKQRAVLVFVVEAIERDQLPPTTREICAGFGWRNPNSAVSHLRALRKKGYLSAPGKQARDIRVLRTPDGREVVGCRLVLAGE